MRRGYGGGVRNVAAAGRNNEARQVLLHLAATHCRGHCTLFDLSLGLGPITVGALSRARGLMAARIRKSAALNARVSTIKALLEDVKDNNKD